MLKLIHIENKIDVVELAKVLKEEREDTVMAVLQILKSHSHALFKDIPGVRQVANLYNIDLNHIA